MLTSTEGLQSYGLDINDLMAKLPEWLQHPRPAIYESNNYTVVDFETTTLDKGSPHNPQNQLLCASWINGPDHPRPGEYHITGSEYEMGQLVSDIQDADYFVAHSAKFEAGWLERCGLPLREMLHACTQLAEKVIAGNRPFGNWAKLQDCCKRRGLKGKDIMGELIRLGVDTLSIQPRWLAEYCTKDVRATEQLWLLQREEMCMDGLLPVFFTRNILTPVLYDIEKPGLCLDPERVHAVWAWHLQERNRLEKQFAELTDGVNPKSNPQKQELLYQRLKLPYPRDDMGRYMLTKKRRSKKEPKLKDVSTDADAIKALEMTTPEQETVVRTMRALLAIRDAQSKLVDKMKACCEEAGGILYGQFHQTNAGTHRLASSGNQYSVQLQNFPRRFRPVVKARNEGWKIGDGDAAGIEFRTAVDLAKDPQGLEDIRSGHDIHAFTASVVFPKEWDGSIGVKEGNNSEVRTRAKAFTFKPLYGGNSGTDAQRAYFAAFRERYSGIAAMQEGWTHTVLGLGELRTASGLKFYWPGCHMSESGYIKYTTQIYDYPVQMFATADMVPTSTVYLWHFMQALDMRSFLIDVVHDSAVGELAPQEIGVWGSLLEYCFNHLIVWYLHETYSYEWVTPLASEMAAYEHWTDGNPDAFMKQWELEESNDSSFKDLEVAEEWAA